ncbi:MAG: FKBP-type peptidyl-prolyl cis-trans isomerase [Oscillospiraceae bacterium]|nr:FKBP-type peptidyl-prolyl cis-trans isomerase [Oscillospiraceae bacterium]
MNSKAKLKKNITRLVALLLAGLMILGLIATSSDTEEILGKTFDYSAPLNKEGYFKDVTAMDVVTLPDYTAYTMPEKYTVADQEAIDEQVMTVIKNFTTEEEDPDTTRAIVDGDTVNIDYVGSIDGVEFEGGSTGGNGTDVTIGVTQYIDDFLQQLIGHKPGENFDIEVTFPDDYGKEELNGKDAVFNITINHFYKTNAPELTDEFVAEKLGNYYKTVDEMIADIEQRIIEDQMKNYVWDKLYAEAEISSYPEAMVKYEKDYLEMYMASYASQMGMTAEDFVIASGYESMEDYLTANEASIQETVKMYATVQAMCEKEGVTVSDEDIVEYFQTYYGTDDYSSFENNYGKPYLKFCILREVMLEGLIEDMEVVATDDAEDAKVTVDAEVSVDTDEETAE